MKKKLLLILTIALTLFLVGSFVACSSKGENGKDGKDGVDGVTPTITISDHSTWVINGTDTGVVAEGQNVYNLYVDVFGYENTEEEWLQEVTSGTLGSAEIRTVTFDYGGADRGDNPERVLVGDGRTISLPDVTREGYDFLGWYTGNGVNDGQWYNNTIVSYDITLIARWKQINCTVRYLGKDGVLLKQEEVAYGEESTPPAPPYVENYTFSDWDKDTSNVTSDMTVNAVYVAHRYTLTFDSDGGSAIDAVSYRFDETPVRPEDPTRRRYAFVGWVNAETEEEFTFDALLTEDTTIKATWNADVIPITNAEELVAMGNDLTAKYALDNDINLDGAEWTPLGTFSGILDGEGHKIFNYRINTTASQMGFFKENSGNIRNLTLTDYYITINCGIINIKIGSIVASNSGEVSNCFADGDILVTYGGSCDGGNYSFYCGGLVAENTTDGSIIHCKSKTSIDCGIDFKYNGWIDMFISGNCALNRGEILSCEDNSVIEVSETEYCRSNAEGTKTVNGNLYIGGITGYTATNTLISDCICYSEISVNSFYDMSAYGGYYGGNGRPLAANARYGYSYISSSVSIGGLVGNITEGAHIEKCRSLANIEQTVDYTDRISYSEFAGGSLTYTIIVGGIAGANSSSIEKSFSKCTISTSKAIYIGGIAGTSTTNSLIRDCYSQTSASGSTTGEGAVGGIAGVNSGAIICSVVEEKISIETPNEGNIIGINNASGLVNKNLVLCESTRNIGTNSGTEGTNYIVTASNKRTIFNEDFLYGENILSINVWGVCEGLSVYLKDFCCEEHALEEEVFPCIERACTALGCMYIEQPAEAHSFVNYIYNNDATCTADGTETGICSRGCGVTNTRVKSGTALGHSLENRPACVDRNCLRCDYVETASMEHTFAVYESNGDATCTADGTETATCACGLTDTRTAENSALGHKFTIYESNGDATCTENGTETAFCENGCGLTHTRTAENSALGHYYIRGKCARCDIHSPELLTALSTVGYYHIDMDRDGEYSLNDYLYFGYYPQTLKKASVTVDSEVNANGYYDGDDGYEYLKAIAHPFTTGYTFSDGTAVTNDTFYYFRIEPIRWQIKSYDGTTALLVSELILDKGSYQDTVSEVESIYYNTTVGTPEGTYANNYAYSSVRAWLNDSFYAGAFSALQKALIQTTTVDNSGSSTGTNDNAYACANTSDKVFLLSEEEATTASLGYVASTGADAGRKKAMSDYVKCIGASMGTGDNYALGDWWLRSPDASSEHNAYYIGKNGNIATANVEASGYAIGILPALFITIDAE